MAMGHRQQLKALHLEPEQGRGSGGGEQRQVGVPVFSGRKTVPKYTGKEPSGNPTGSHWHWEFGMSVGYGTHRPFPLFEKGWEDGQARYLQCQTAEILSRVPALIPGVRNAGMSSDSHLDQTPGTPGRRPETGSCPSRFLLQQGTVGVQATPWMDVLFTNRHLKVFQLTELKP